MKLRRFRAVFALLAGMMMLAACGRVPDDATTEPAIDGERAEVLAVVDGDTIRVRMLATGTTENVRYVGINTPERDEPCYAEATAANREYVSVGTEVTLVRDQTDRDRFDRLLRYIYVGDVFVEEELVRRGFAEAVLYEPDDRFYRDLLTLEREARAANIGCHPTGIFDDGTDLR